MPPSRTRIACVYVPDLVTKYARAEVRNLRPPPGFPKDRNRSIARRVRHDGACLNRRLPLDPRIAALESL
jgi:hypothetical protein